MKLQCACGAKYAFEVQPEMLSKPVQFVCPSCGLDSSAFVNQLVQQELGVAPPPVAKQGLPGAGCEVSSHLTPATAGYHPTFLFETSWTAHRRALCRLQQTALPEMHGALRVCLLALVQAESRIAGHRSPGVCRKKSRGRAPALAQSRTRRGKCRCGGGCIFRRVDLV